MPSDAHTPLRDRLGPITAVAASFFLNAAVRAPVPGVNEPHYLTKAKHYWNPEWCRGDFFLASADTHRVFYEAFGPLTLFLSLPVIAVLGRTFAHVVLAIGWTELVSRVVPGRWTPLFAAWLFLGLVAIGNLSGEWIVGGLEAKVFGYGYAFLALAWAIDRRWLASAITVGFAIAWHPLVGLWCCAAAAIGAIGLCVRDARIQAADSSAAGDAPNPRSHNLLHALLCLFLAALCALPGLLPAFRLFDAPDTRPPDAPWTRPVDDLSFASDYIQVEHRLGHHLDPMRTKRDPATRKEFVWFPFHVWLAYAAMAALWLVGRRSFPSRAEREFAGFVWGSIVIALVGLLIGLRTVPFGEWARTDYEAVALRVKLLKFYWFRVADIVVPMAFCMVATAWGARRSGTTIVAAVTGFVFGLTLLQPGAAGTVTTLTAEERAGWYDVCEWVREHTPEESRFRTPQSAIAFKWHAERPEFLSQKDCPQDPAGIVEWNERLNFQERWSSEAYADGRYSEAEIREFSEAIGVDYFIAWHLDPIDMQPVFESANFRVYDVRPEP